MYLCENKKICFECTNRRGADSKRKKEEEEEEEEKFGFERLSNGRDDEIKDGWTRTTHLQGPLSSPDGATAGSAHGD